MLSDLEIAQQAKILKIKETNILPNKTTNIYELLKARAKGE